MTSHDVFFAIVGGLSLLSALAAVTSKRILHAAIWLVAALGCVAGCYLVLAAEFVALVQLVVYVGAVVVLVLFALMLTRSPLGRTTDHDTSLPQRALALVVSTATAAMIGGVLITAFSSKQVRLRPGTTDDLATQIFATWSWPFELLSLLLLIALVTAIALSRLQFRADTDEREGDA
ncbi:NADH-quinone oxidoreductase subunit J family protein [Calidifontibacter terrae]